MAGAPYLPGRHPPLRGQIIVWNSRDPLGGRTKEEFRKLCSEPSPDFWKSAVETMRRIV
jgi:hypothetical protein